MSHPPPRRTPRPAPVRALLYRVVVPVLLVAFGVVALAILLLAAGVLLGVVPYPGR